MTINDSGRESQIKDRVWSAQALEAPTSRPERTNLQIEEHPVDEVKSLKVRIRRCWLCFETWTDLVLGGRHWSRYLGHSCWNPPTSKSTRHPIDNLREKFRNCKQRVIANVRPKLI